MAMVGVDPSAIELRAIAANTTVGLDWSRVSGATAYRVYWSNAPGVTATSGHALDVPDPAYVHRGLSNGQAYYYKVSAMLGSMEGPLSPEANATPTGEWVLEALGSGDFDDVLTGARVTRLPIEKRVQVFLLPEGYLSSDLAVFHDAATHDAGNNDVDRWIAEVFALDPYSKFKEAFVIWYLPRASAAHLGAGSTAFSVTLTSGSVTDVSAAAAPLWGALDAQGSDAFLFAPGTSQPPNFVAACMLFDPMRGRAGFSGVTTNLRNPSVAAQSIGTAFAMGHAHEFTHAFARVADEYMETSGHAPMGTSETTNVVASNRCDQLPWAHLLEGRGINTTAGLVGAFGTPALGYHSELTCHMNGTHDNGTVFCMSSDQAYSSLTLRTDHLCNYCRELTAFRLFERTAILGGSTSFADWKSMYRMPFFQRFGFFVPPGAIPETLSCNRNMPMPVYEACTP
jgi:hypothetical protein